VKKKEKKKSSGVKVEGVEAKNKQEKIK